jgi:hypothetical protein
LAALPELERNSSRPLSGGGGGGGSFALRPDDAYGRQSSGEMPPPLPVAGVGGMDGGQRWGQRRGAAKRAPPPLPPA